MSPSEAEKGDLSRSESPAGCKARSLQRRNRTPVFPQVRSGISGMGQERCEQIFRYQVLCLYESRITLCCAIHDSWPFVT